MEPICTTCFGITARFPSLYQNSCSFLCLQISLSVLYIMVNTASYCRIHRHESYAQNSPARWNQILQGLCNEAITVLILINSYTAGILFRVCQHKFRALYIDDQQSQCLFSIISWRSMVWGEQAGYTVFISTENVKAYSSGSVSDLTPYVRSVSFYLVTIYHWRCERRSGLHVHVQTKPLELRISASRTAWTNLEVRVLHSADQLDLACITCVWSQQWYRLVRGFLKLQNVSSFIHLRDQLLGETRTGIQHQLAEPRRDANACNSSLLSWRNFNTAFQASQRQPNCMSDWRGYNCLA